MEEIRLTKLAIRAYKNPCDKSKQQIFGVGYPYCYFIQFYSKLNINRFLLCKCGKNYYSYPFSKETFTKKTCNFCKLYKK